MDAATHKDIKFYFCTIIGAVLMFTALFVPPVGVVDTSILYGCAAFLILAGVVEGADVKGIIREIRLLKECNRQMIEQTTNKPDNQNDSEV